ncbi:cyanase [Methanogenium organophilum]|uniref:Cyanate hydratase n=1 Tax=Methanogenium organophilum TaxID=2199 RepID=A0A9X9S446_METOG|nr:cyanase [Methanogenium organophilum]WAI01428.1 cyanase [Methanogenium organophilum]
MKKEECTEMILSAMSEKGLTFGEMAEKVGRHEVWVATALFGQASMSKEEAETVGSVLGLDADCVKLLQECPYKGSLSTVVPTDPLIYRLYEIMAIYGMPLKAIVHEKFGDGIMSAIDFEVDVRKMEDPKGDRVIIELNGKFLPYKKW